jgi:hypothetical protein
MRKVSERHNKEINGISRLAYAIAGNARKFYDLPREKRGKIRASATTLYHIGADYVTATKAQATERRGFVYIISHPRFNGYIKIGRAFDPESRLAGYQTGCPERAYRLDYAVYFEDCHGAEQKIHAHLAGSRVQGEWFAMAQHVAVNIIDNFRECENVG